MKKQKVNQDVFTGKEVEEVKSGSIVEQLKWETVSESLETWDFNENPLFLGYFEEEQTVGEGDKSYQTYVFTEAESQERYFVDKTYSVEKAIEKVKSEKKDLHNIIFRIEFIEKTEIKGKPFNRFKIDIATLKR